MSETVLCINTGSWSLKFTLFRMNENEEARICRGAVEHIGRDAQARAWFEISGRRSEEDGISCPDHRAALERCFALLAERQLPKASAIGHRVVHGGPDYVTPAPIDDTLLTRLKELVSLAPLHMPAALAGIEAARTNASQVRQVACFDTAFHARIPEVARRFAIPLELYEAGARRYGFHGLSYEYVMSTLGRSPPARIVIAHLGAGASLVGVRDGVAIDTTMGLTPTGGIMMGSRTGDLDPGVLFYIARQRGLSIDALEKLVNQESGLKSVAGTSDMRTLIARKDQDPRAELAFEMFCYGVRRAIAGLAASLAGLDLLVFTGGIGEHAAEVRARSCAGLEFLGIELDGRLNAEHARDIHSASSRTQVRVISTDEDLMIARHTFRLRAR